MKRHVFLIFLIHLTAASLGFLGCVLLAHFHSMFFEDDERKAPWLFALLLLSLVANFPTVVLWAYWFGYWTITWAGEETETRSPLT